MRINRPAIWLGAVLVVLAVSIPTGYVLLANEADATADHYADRGAAMGEAFVEGSESVALRINGHSVTVAEFLEVRAEKSIGLERIEAILSRAVPDDDPDIENREWIEQCLNCYSRFFEDDSKKLPESFVALFRPAYEVSQSYDVDVLTLARLLMKYTAYDAAVEAGYGMTGAEVQAAVTKDQHYYSQRGLTVSETDHRTGEAYQLFIDPDPELLAYIEAVGETKYWNEIRPERKRVDGTVSKWLMARNTELREKGVPSVEGANLQHYAELIKESALEITGELEIDATRDQALEFLVRKFRVDGYDISLTP